MAREITVSCDPCLTENKKKTPAEIGLFALRFNDPNELGTAQTIVGALDICTGHQGFAAELKALLEKYGQPLNSQGRDLLRAAVSLAGNTEDTGYRLCTTCPRGKLLKKNSLYTHNQRLHDGLEGDANFKMCDSDGNIID